MGNCCSNFAGDHEWTQETIFSKGSTTMETAANLSVRLKECISLLRAGSLRSGIGSWSALISQPSSVLMVQKLFHHTLSLTPKQHSLMTPKSRYLTTPKPHSLTTPKSHSLTTPKPHSLTTTKPHSLTTPKPRSLTPKPHFLTPKPHSWTPKTTFLWLPNHIP